MTITTIQQGFDGKKMAVNIKNSLSDALSKFKKAAVTVDVETHEELFLAASFLNKAIAESIERKDYQSAKTLSAKLAKVLANRQKNVSLSGHAVKNTVFLVSALALKEIKALAVSNTDKLAAFLGANVYPYDTTTRFLALKLNDTKYGIVGKTTEDDIPGESGNGKFDGKDLYGEGSFRGQYGIYAALLKLGFILKKENIKADGTKGEDGAKVRLWVNLDWLFGQSINQSDEIQNNNENTSILATILAKERGNSTQHSKHTHIQYTNTFEAANNAESCGKVENSATNGIVHSLSRLTAETFSMEKRGEKSDFGKNEIPARCLHEQANKNNNNEVIPAESLREPSKFAVPAPPVVEIGGMVGEAVKLAEKIIYTPHMYAKMRIRTNKDTVIKADNPAYKQDELLKMQELYKFLKAKFAPKTWAEVDALVKKAINQTAEYLKKNPSRYIYTKTMFFDVRMKEGSLLDTILKFIDFEAKRKTMKINELRLKLEKDSLDIDWIKKFIEDGADKFRTMRFVKSKGKEFVTDCIRYAYAHTKRGFVPLNGIVAYIFGIIHNAEPHKIRESANKEELLLSAGELITRKEAQKEKKEKDITEAKRLFGIIRDAANDLKVRLSNDEIKEIIEKAMKNNANETQIYTWVKGKQNKKP